MKKLSILRLITICLFAVLAVTACKQPAGNKIEDIYCSTLVISADTNCLVFVDGDFQGTFNTGDARKVHLCKGEHLVVAKSLDSTVILAKHIIAIGDSVSKVVDLQIAQNLTIAEAIMSQPPTDVTNTGQIDTLNSKTAKPSKSSKPVKTPKSESPAVVEEPEPMLEPVAGTYVDPRDGKNYKTIKIGSQTWLAENLAYRSPQGCWVYNNDESNVAKFGYLYNWETARTACPPGWRLPSDADWSKLIKYLGGFQKAGGKMKSTAVWSTPNTGASNASGFSAYPGGYYYFSKDGYYLNGTYGLWWTSTEIGPSTAYYIHLLSDNPYAFRSNGKKEDGLSIRCVK